MGANQRISNSSGCGSNSRRTVRKHTSSLCFVAAGGTPSRVPRRSTYRVYRFTGGQFKAVFTVTLQNCRIPMPKISGIIMLMSVTVAKEVVASPEPHGGAARPLQIAWLVVALAAGALLWVLWHVWMSLPEMNDRFLIPIAAGWLVYRNRSRWEHTATQPTASGMALVVLGAVLWPTAWYLLVQVGPRVLLLWWLGIALALAAFGLLLIQFGWPRTRLMIFPIAFCFLALPTPDRLQTPLQSQLKEYTTAATAAVLPAIGIPAERHGNVLKLKSGQLGVVDACSGVRSVTALTAIALFVAYLRGFSLWRGVLLVIATMGIVVVSNSIRVIVTGILQETVGPHMAQGWAHEVLGYLVILVGLALIVGISSLLAPRSVRRKSLENWPVADRRVRGGLVALLAVGSSLAASLWAEQFRAAHLETVNLNNLPTRMAAFEGENEPIDEAVAEMLKCDQILHRVYEGKLGQKFELYVMYWATPASTAHMHHPDICMPCQGWTIDAKRLHAVTYQADRPAIPVSVREYSQDGKRELVFYWTQTGAQLLADGPEDTEHYSEYAWVKQMLTGSATIKRNSRLSVRIDAELTGEAEHQEQLMDEFCSVVAREIYKLFPWAMPEN
jgi:EpsI family protein